MHRVSHGGLFTSRIVTYFNMHLCPAGLAADITHLLPRSNRMSVVYLHVPAHPRNDGCREIFMQNLLLKLRELIGCHFHRS